MVRFFVDAGRVRGEEVLLDAADSRHLLTVLRRRPGDRFLVLADGMEYEAELTGTEGGLATGRVLAARPAAGESPLAITLFQGLAKGDKMDLVLQKGTELGVTAFVPTATARAVVQLEARKAEARRERWQRIVREAAEQCRRGALPVVEAPVDWPVAAAMAGAFDLALVPWEEGGAPPATVLAPLVPAARPDREGGGLSHLFRPRLRVAVYIGPEGGLTAEEVALARQHGAVPVSLGPRILRTETAGVAVAAVLQYALGDVGG